MYIIYNMWPPLYVEYTMIQKLIVKHAYNKLFDFK